LIFHVGHYYHYKFEKQLENIFLSIKMDSMNGGGSMSNLPNCPKCNSEYTYEDGSLFICPECTYEWTAESEAETNENEKVVTDSNGAVLTDGDTVTVIKDLKVKGSSSVIKMGTKVKNIRLVDGDHDIDCKIDGFGAMKLKSEFVKKI
jgi:protein PhnA